MLRKATEEDLSALVALRLSLIHISEPRDA